MNDILSIKTLNPVVTEGKKLGYEPEDIVKEFFNVISAEEKTYQCMLCEKAISSKKGFTNLLNHLSIEKHVKNCIQKFKEKGVKLNTINFNNSISNLNTSKESILSGQDIYNWLNWIITLNLPFSFVDKIETRKYANLHKICSKTLKKYANILNAALTDYIKTILPNKFALVFDGWSADGTSNFHLLLTLLLIINRYSLHSPLCYFLDQNSSS